MGNGIVHNSHANVMDELTPGTSAGATVFASQFSITA